MASLWKRRLCGLPHGSSAQQHELFSMGFEDMDQRKAKGPLDRQLVVKENDPANQGRASLQNELEAFAFKVPQLYNLRDHAAFGHGLSYTTLREVVDHMNNGRSANNDTGHSTQGDV